MKKKEEERSNKIKEENEKQRSRRPNNPQLKEEIEPFIPECWDVAIELTPPCDYSQNNRKMARLVGGYIFDVPLGKLQETSKNHELLKSGVYLIVILKKNILLVQFYWKIK